MAEYEKGFDTESPQEDRSGCGRRGPSVLLLLAGIAALLVSGWALIGPFSLDFLSGVDAGWVLVGVAVVVGAVLVFLPSRRGK